MGKGTREDPAARLPAASVAGDYLYHYTGSTQLDDILESCKLRPSHAQWGYGVYLTDIAPAATNRERLSRVFGSRRFYAERLEACIERDKADAQQHPGDKHVFVASGQVSIAGEPVEVDTSGWRTARFDRCAPDLEELRAAFERLGPLRK